MKALPASPEEFQSFLSAALSQMVSAKQRDFLATRLIKPYKVELLWEYGKDEAFEAWCFADMDDRDVVVQYCLGGHGALGSPWGINARDSDHFGMDCGWYQNLTQLVADWGVEP